MYNESDIHIVYCINFLAHTCNIVAWQPLFMWVATVVLNHNIHIMIYNKYTIYIIINTREYISVCISSV